MTTYQYKVSFEKDGQLRQLEPCSLTRALNLLREVANDGHKAMIERVVAARPEVQK